MIRAAYENRLNDMYTRHFCYGQCVHYSECKKGQLDDGLFFNRAKIGEEYGNGTYRKVLIVGKEPITEHREITRTASLEESNNPHYRRTLYTLATLLQEEPKGDTIDDLEINKDLLRYFCLTNYFKCAFTETEMKPHGKVAKKNSGVKANKKMKTHCFEILLNEIEALTPEIIIIQGKSYSKVFYSELQKKYGKNLLPEEEYTADYEQLTKHKYQNGDPMYIVWAYHPTARAEKAWEKRLVNLRYVLGKLKARLKET